GTAGEGGRGATEVAGDAAPTGLPAAPAPVDRGPLHVDPAARSASVEGAPLELTRTEFDLLLLLVTHPGRAFSRDFLLERVWGYDYDGAGRTVDSHVMRLRRKLGPLGEQIVTVWGVGYRFVD
ncbi:MAG TPA: winged helix-turn-helix domain-containing protein, partial [Chloroflexota bacterium]|nr:winged helix-turn-helix domain-containing protein [Chloroflexota bacterium]